MSYDGVATAAAVSELQQNLTLGKIEKIYQPHSEQLIFNIHTKAGRKKLLLSVSGNHAGAYLTETVPENPASPPVFCMVMRKHLNAGRITQIQQHENDRIIEILLETVNEMGFSVNKKLIIEIMGKHSNVILTDMTSGKIIDSIKHISIDVNRARQILPGKRSHLLKSPGRRFCSFLRILCSPGDAFSPVYRDFLPHWQKLWHPIFQVLLMLQKNLHRRCIPGFKSLFRRSGSIHLHL